VGKAKELSLAARESIARKLFTVKEHLAGRNELHGLCPFHEDSNPSFGYNYQKDQYNCFTCGAGGDLIKLWSHVRGTGKEADNFKAFCREYGLPLTGSGKQSNQDADRPSPPPDKPTDSAKEKKIPQSVLTRAWEKMEPLPSTWMKRLSASRGWSESAMQHLSLRVQTCRWDKKQGALVDIKKPDRVAIPVFDADGAVRNIRCYKPGSAKVKIFSFGPGCGDARLFPAAPSADGVVLLVEGEGDAICALSNGFNAITQTSKTKYWSAAHTAPFKDRDVVIAYDADQPGWKYAQFAATSLFKIARSVRMLVWPDYMGRKEDGSWPDDHGQDLTDFFVKHKKTPADLKLLIDTADPFTSEDACIANPMEFFDYGPNGRSSFKPRLLADRICRDFSLVSDPESGLVYRWNGSYFERYPEEHIEKSCLEYLGDEAQQSRVKDATFQAKRLSQVPFGRALNDQDDWICILNGMLNMRTMELRPHDKKFYATYQLPVSFDPNRTARCDRFLQYLEETIQTPGPIAQVQEFAGYCLTREVRYEKALLLLGPGADGKSKLIAILRALVGAENCSAVSFQDLENEFHRSSLYGKLLNISTEVGSKAMESAYFKAIVSGDPISAAFKHENSFQFCPQCKLVFAGNRMPRILDNSDGPFRRLLPISFKRQFLDDGDPHLLEKLMSELSEIFQWALVGLHRLWQQKRFTDCEETRDLLMEHRRANNPVLCFVEDMCVLGDYQEVSKEDLYKSYKKYTGANGYLTLGAENFFRELYAAVANVKQFRPRRKDGSRPYYISGIGIDQEVGNG
jgi:putative DNA primase/helicase